MSHVSDGSLHAYLDGEAGERERAEVERHLASCVTCRERLEEAETVRDRASELLADYEPAGVRMPAWREIEERARVRGQTSQRQRRSWVRPGLAWAASIALAFVIGFASGGLVAPTNFAAREEVSPRQQPSLERAEPAAPATAPAAGEEDDAMVTGRATEGTPPTGSVAPSDAASSTSSAEAADRAPARLRDQAPAEAQTLAEEAAPAAEPPVAAAPTAGAERDEARAERESSAAAPPAVSEGKAAQPVPSQDAVPAAVREQAQFRLDARRREVAGAELDQAGESMNRAKLAGEYFSVSADAATEWLGVRMRTLPELELVRVEVGPGSTLDTGSIGRPAIRLVYRDAAANEITLLQQWTGTAVGEESDPMLVIEPSGSKSYRWHDGGYRLVLQGTVSADSLRSLASRVR